VLTNYKKDKMNEMNHIHFFSIYIFDNEPRVWMVTFCVHYLLDTSQDYPENKLSKYE